MMRDAFSSYHPAVNFLYFALVLLFTMVFMHPAALLISLIGAFAWSAYLGGRRAVCINLLYMVPMLLLTALVNPAFNHEGATMLLYLPTGNPLTLESILYGFAASTMLIAVLCWLSCYNKIITSDKFVYLFGRIIPAMSLILSMVLRFVPKFQQQLKTVSNAQKCVGRDVSNGSLFSRAKHGVKILSIMITWALENAIETADSMKSRGYGLPGRTAFSIYRFDERDRAALWTIGGLGGYILMMALAGGFGYRYFPTFRIAPWDAWSVSGMAAYIGLCLTPLIIDLADDYKWKRLSARQMTDIKRGNAGEGTA